MCGIALLLQAKTGKYEVQGQALAQEMADHKMLQEKVKPQVVHPNLYEKVPSSAENVCIPYIACSRAHSVL